MYLRFFIREEGTILLRSRLGLMSYTVDTPKSALTSAFMNNLVFKDLVRGYPINKIYSQMLGRVYELNSKLLYLAGK
jgi:hypothetical protein